MNHKGNWLGPLQNIYIPKMFLTIYIWRFYETTSYMYVVIPNAFK